MSKVLVVLTSPFKGLYVSKWKATLANIKILLGGNYREELIFGADEITTGASNDIQKASSLIVDYINKYGMDPDMGLFSTQVFQEE